MAGHSNPTYMLVPEWTTYPNGKIQLGNIISNPGYPQKWLTQPSPALTASETHSITQKNFNWNPETSRSFNVSLWTRFLETINIRLGANREKAKIRSFVIDSMETITYQQEPDAESLVDRARDPKIMKCLKPGSVVHGPVYLIHGIKVARGLKASTTNSRSHGFETEAGGEIVPWTASVGASFGVQTSNSSPMSYDIEEDVIFAYQLLRIKPKGWKGSKGLKVEEFQSSAALLSDKKKSGKEEVLCEFELDLADADDLLRDHEGMQIVHARDDDNDEVKVLYKKG